MSEIKVKQCSHQRVPSVSLITRRASGPLKDDEAAFHLHQHQLIRLIIRGTYHACPDSGARRGPVACRSIPPPAPGRWKQTREDRSSDSYFHPLCHRPDSPPGSYLNWSLPSYCKRDFRCYRLPTPRIHHRKSAGSRSESALPRGATVPSFHTPPSFVSPEVELLHPARFGMQMTSLAASNPAYSLLHQTAVVRASASRSSAGKAAGARLSRGEETKVRAAGAVRPAWC